MQMRRLIYILINVSGGRQGGHKEGEGNNANGSRLGFVRR